MSKCLNFDPISKYIDLVSIDLKSKVHPLPHIQISVLYFFIHTGIPYCCQHLPIFNFDLNGFINDKQFPIFLIIPQIYPEIKYESFCQTILHSQLKAF